MVAMLQAPETVLFVPDAAEDALELLVTLYEFQDRGPDGALTDRWRVHHGDPLKHANPVGVFRVDIVKHN